MGDRLFIMAMAFRIMLAIVVISASGRVAWSDDHDHGGGHITITVSPRVEARLGNMQLVLIYANRKAVQDTTFRFFGSVEPVKLVDPRIVVFLERFEDAVPVRGAKLEAVINFLPEELTEAAPGVYLSQPIVLAGGRNEVELNYSIGDESGTLPLMLVVPGGATSGTGAVAIEAPVKTFPSWLFALVAIMIYTLLIVLFFRHRGRRSTDKPVAAVQASKHAA